MKIPADCDLYYNTQTWFAGNMIPDLPNDDRIWAREYRLWLKQQGACLVSTNEKATRNGIGVAPRYDYIEFESEQHYLMFCLRWS